MKLKPVKDELPVLVLIESIHIFSVGTAFTLDRPHDSSQAPQPAITGSPHPEPCNGSRLGSEPALAREGDELLDLDITFVELSPNKMSAAAPRQSLLRRGHTRLGGSKASKARGLFGGKGIFLRSLRT